MLGKWACPARCVHHGQAAWTGRESDKQLQHKPVELFRPHVSGWAVPFGLRQPDMSALHAEKVAKAAIWCDNIWHTDGVGSRAGKQEQEQLGGTNINLLVKKGPMSVVQQLRCVMQTTMDASKKGTHYGNAKMLATK